MRYRVVRHPLVRSDLTNITVFIGDYAGYDIAENKISEIERHFLTLAEFPHIGSIRHDVYPGLRAISAAEKAIVCFTVDDDRTEVYIICVSYGGADWQSKVRERHYIV